MWTTFIILSVFAFSGTLTTSFDLRGVINGNRMGGVPLGMTLGAGELDIEGICTKAGVACQNCTLAVTCVSLPVGWLKVPLEECTEGFTCNAHVGRCSAIPVPECDAASQDFKHTCEQVGIFPDAYDCRKFHLCSPPEGMPDGRPADHREALCPRHYGYNPQTAQCSVKLEHGQCKERPVPVCTQVGQYGVLPTSSNHYYVCLNKYGVLYPQIFICPHGWHFSGGFCQPEIENINNINLKETYNIPSTTEETITEESKVVEQKDSSTEATTTKVDVFFSTDKVTTYAADTFLADKYDLSNYDTIDDAATNNGDSFNSFEDTSFWQ